MRREHDDEGDALHRCLCREVATGSALLGKVRSDLAAVARLCQGEVQATNEVGGYRGRKSIGWCHTGFHNQCSVAMFPGFCANSSVERKPISS